MLLFVLFRRSENDEIVRGTRRATRISTETHTMTDAAVKKKNYKSYHGFMYGAVS